MRVRDPGMTRWRSDDRRIQTIGAYHFLLHSQRIPSKAAARTSRRQYLIVFDVRPISSGLGHAAAYRL
jgi:hypothetical protein